MDGFSRILEKKLSELLCTRLYVNQTLITFTNYSNHYHIKENKETGKEEFYFRSCAESRTSLNFIYAHLRDDHFSLSASENSLYSLWSVHLWIKVFSFQPVQFSRTCASLQFQNQNVHFNVRHPVLCLYFNENRQTLDQIRLGNRQEQSERMYKKSKENNQKSKN